MNKKNRNRLDIAKELEPPPGQNPPSTFLTSWKIRLRAGKPPVLPPPSTWTTESFLSRQKAAARFPRPQTMNIEC